MNLLPPEKLAALEKYFDEGRGIRETERLTGVHRDTVSRYFRVFSDPLPEAPPETVPGVVASDARYVVVEHDNDWHVFYVHNDTPEWWRHVATFHNESRAQLYAEDCSSWLDVLRTDGADFSRPIADETPAPERMPPPPTIPEADQSRPLTKEERKAATEKRQNELAAALPERRCAVCDVVLTRRRGEPVSNFAIRQTCTPEHAQVRREQVRARQNGAISPKPEPTVEPEPAPEQVDVGPNGEEDPPPGYRDCPDCVWSGPRTEYQDHRRTDHP